MLSNGLLLLLTIAFGVANFIFYPAGFGASIISRLFTSFLSAIIVKIVVERTLERHQEKKERPRQKAYYREIKVFYDRLRRFFDPTALNITEQHKTELERLPAFSLDRLKYIETHLDIWGSSRVSYGGILNMKMSTVFQWFDIEYRNIKILGETVLNRYNANLPPELFGYVFEIISDGEWERLKLNLEGFQHNRKVNELKPERKNDGFDLHEKTYFSRGKWENILNNAIAIERWLDDNKHLTEK